MERGTVSGVPHGQSTAGLLGGWNSLCSHPNLFQRSEQCQVEFESETISTQRSLLLSSLSRRFMLQTQGSGPFCSSMDISQKLSECRIRLQYCWERLSYDTVHYYCLGHSLGAAGGDMGQSNLGTVPGEVIGTPVVHVPVILSLFYELGTGLFKDTHTNLGRQPMSCGMEESSSPLKSALHLTRCSQAFFLDLL